MVLTEEEARLQKEPFEVTWKDEEDKVCMYMYIYVLYIIV